MKPASPRDALIFDGAVRGRLCSLLVESFNVELYVRFVSSSLSGAVVDDCKSVPATVVDDVKVVTEKHPALLTQYGDRNTVLYSPSTEMETPCFAHPVRR